ncbi:MAG: DNA repair protein RecO [Gemmatimonadetes bacterium]|uniref:DNA repair protein RecO n=1 Tax=Candidatus Kutchimonas denitrificans TaxID=3056748 RepID=A0AAE5C9P6_9BACT|nr:DNA repair protein RecO [Gemmatimonadota bacterium]NIR75706.1 DNA repair protein RecO [Candidatus Kutchimonas denitrificans]NIS00319.1 DNA repair protein RecO [Gemmatimonadota bacterium]NIT65978.1 DNA repair protein RecO [Gemmatimonadota bacterium]NIU53682.1 DNA repair protein RecO [Gemmatimonadota bacterium]
MGLVSTPATVLKTYEYSETSKILRLLTRDHGLCSAIAKGARRPRSRFGGLLEPFSDGVATFYVKEGRELHTLSGFELRRERQALGRELVRYAGAGLLTEIALRFASSEPDRELFEQLGRSLDRLVAQNGAVETAVLEETWRLIVRLGFAPALDPCSGCGRSPAPDETTHFDLVGGGIICDGCRRESAALSLKALAPRARTELALLVAGAADATVLETIRFQRNLLRDFIAYHLADHRPLNSFHFLEQRLG